MLHTTKRILFLVWTLAVFVTTSDINAQEKKSAHKPLRLFLIGNSFSQNASRYLVPLSNGGGHELVIGRAELGGCSLQRHWDSVAVSILDSSRGKAYDGKSLKQLLSAGTWDVITLQQYSLLSADVDTYSPYAKNLYDFIKKLQPDAQIILHQTWAYRSDANSFGRVKGFVTAKNQQEMWEKSRAAYHTIAKQLGVQIIPSGDAFWMAATSKDMAFKKDEAFNYEQPVYPSLPVQTNSLNVGYTWNRAQKITFDPNHANEAGCYLAGLVWYSVLWGESPLKVSFKPENVTDEFAGYLKKTAWDAVVKNGKDKAITVVK